VVWELRGDFGLDENPMVGFSKEEGRFGFVAARLFNQRTSRIRVTYDQFRDIGKYFVWGRVGQVPGQQMNFGGRRSCAAVRENPGTLHIEYINEVDRIIAGKFQFQGICDDGDTIEVTDGWLDLQY
jgi:hypothetical protein